jgi:hypothetical protein
MKRLVSPREIPLVIRRTLVVQCDGEWERVTTDGAGGFIVHNNAMKAAAYVAGTTPVFQEPLATAPPLSKQDPWYPPRVSTRKLREPVVKPKKVASNAEVRALAHVLSGESNRRIQPGVNVVSADRVFRPNEWLTSFETDAPEWTTLSDEALDLTSYELFLTCQNGLPAETAFVYHPDVLALHGFGDAEEEIRATLRQPSRVEIRPETAKKRYPVLGFWRGDVNVILGLQRPSQPAVIAAYYDSLLAHDTHRVNSHGGGGSRGEDGIPKTPQAVARRLRQLGAEVDTANPRATSTKVIFRGQDLGAISLGSSVNRATCQQDWQRMQRKIHAITQREGAA